MQLFNNFAKFSAKKICKLKGYMPPTTEILRLLHSDIVTKTGGKRRENNLLLYTT